MAGMVAVVLVAGVGGWRYLKGEMAWPLFSERPALLKTSTEDLPQGHQTPSRAMVNALFADASNEYLVDAFDTCRREKGLEHLPPERWFVSVPLPPLGDDPPIYVLRGALEPYCLAFYGAHTFDFWLLQAEHTALGPLYKVIDSGSGDFLAVRPTHHDGAYDLDMGVCTSVHCTYFRQRREGDDFKMEKCWREHHGDVKSVRIEPLPCESIGS